MKLPDSSPASNDVLCLSSGTRRAFFVTAAAAMAGMQSARAEQRAVLGVVPYLPSRRLISLYAPLVPIVEKSINRPVDILIATSWPQHLQMLRAGTFDLVADSVIMTRIAQREIGHAPIVRTLAALEPQLVVPQSSDIRAMSDLRGRMLCVTDRIAALSIFGLRYMRDQGLQPDRDFQVVPSGSHANSLHRMLNGDAAAAVVSKTTLIQVDNDLRSRVRVLRSLPGAFSAVLYHAAPRLAPHNAKLARDIIQFSQNTPEGHAFIKALGHIGLGTLEANQLKSLDPMVVEFYRQLGA